MLLAQAENSLLHRSARGRETHDAPDGRARPRGDACRRTCDRVPEHGFQFCCYVGLHMYNIYKNRRTARRSALAMATSSLGLLASNYEEESEEEAPAAAPSGSRALVVNPTPTVVGDYGGAGSSSTALAFAAQVTEDHKYGQQVMKTNPTYEEMWAPEQGPALDPAGQRAAGIKSKQRFVGHVSRYEPATDFAFEEQYHTFNAYGFAYDPSAGAGSSGQNSMLGPQQASVAGVVGDVERWAEARGESVYSRKGPLESKMEEQRKRLRLDENYEQIPTAQPELTAEQKAAIEERLKQEKKKCERCLPCGRSAPIPIAAASAMAFFWPRRMLVVPRWLSLPRPLLSLGASRFPASRLDPPPAPRLKRPPSAPRPTSPSPLPQVRRQGGRRGQDRHDRTGGVPRRLDGRLPGSVLAHAPDGRP